MNNRFRILTGLHSSTAAATPPPPQPTPDEDVVYLNSEFILFIGLFIIVCFILCLIIVNAAARCTWMRWFSNNVITTTTTRIDHFSLSATKLLRSIPKLTYSSESMVDNFTDCAICLTEFVNGEQIRVLPQCGHCFHVVCVDRWIGTHFTCPSCRQMLLKTMRSSCNRCDNVPVAGVTGIRSAMAGDTRVTIDRFIRF